VTMVYCVCGASVPKIAAKCVTCSRERSHRDCYPEQYAHPLVGRVVSFKGEVLGAVERVAESAFGSMVHIVGDDPSVAYRFCDLYDAQSETREESPVQPQSNTGICYSNTKITRPWLALEFFESSRQALAYVLGSARACAVTSALIVAGLPAAADPWPRGVFRVTTRDTHVNTFREILERVYAAMPINDAEYQTYDLRKKDE
jgi:hypothetical protein